MKLILYKHNLLPESYQAWRGIVSLANFPKHIREMARYAETVEYHDGQDITVIKERGAKVGEGTNWQAVLPASVNFSDLVNTQLAESVFRDITLEQDRWGIRKVVLER